VASFSQVGAVGSLLAYGFSLATSIFLPAGQRYALAFGLSETASREYAQVPNVIIEANGVSVATDFSGLAPFTSLASLHGVSVVTAADYPSELSIVTPPSQMKSFTTTREYARPYGSPLAYGVSETTTRAGVRPSAHAEAAALARTASSGRGASITSALTRAADRVASFASGLLSGIAEAVGLSRSAAAEALTLSSIADSYGNVTAEAVEYGVGLLRPQAVGLSEVATSAKSDHSVTRSLAGSSFVATSTAAGPAAIVATTKGLAASTTIAQTTYQVASFAQASTFAAGSVAGVENVTSQAWGSSYAALREYFSQPHVLTPYFDIDFEMELSPLIAASFELDPLVGFEMTAGPQIDFTMETGDE
jgi:hypothetical protein